MLLVLVLVFDIKVLVFGLVNSIIYRCTFYISAVVAASRALQRSDFSLFTVGSGRFSPIQFVLLRAS